MVKGAVKFPFQEKKGYWGLSVILEYVIQGDRY